MLLPANFTTVISNTFYDKTVTKLAKTTTSTDGWVEESGTPTGTFKANVRHDNLGAAQTEMGLSEQIDVVITCFANETVNINDLLKYGNVTYKVMSVIPTDSHLKIAGQKWL